MLDQTPGDPLPSEPLPRDSSSNMGKLGMGFIKYGDEEVRVLRVLSGGMGEVYICDDGGHFNLALKTFQKRLFFRRAAREAFEREVRIWIQLTGLPHILPAFDLIYHDNRPFVSMMAVFPPPSGETTVRDLLNQGPLPRKQVYSFAVEVAKGLYFAQERIPGLVHGDLKPENLLLIFGQSCWISDFGLAQVITEADPQAQLESTWAYRSPENWHAPANVSPLSDIYSFGVILYEMLTGKPPFQATARKEWSRLHRKERPRPPKGFPQEGTDAALMTLALRCLQKKPADRPQGFKSILDELFRLARGDDDFEQALRLVRATEESSLIMQTYFFRVKQIESLIKNGDHQLALTHLETLLQDYFDARLWLLYGDALALNGRDEEALSAFETALQLDLTEQETYKCYQLYALSLKHLGRFQEAIDLYKHLLVKVPDQMLEMVINLATVYIESDQPEEALRCLLPFMRDHPEIALGWVNLGSAYRSLERYAAAVTCYQRALGIAPEMAQVQVLLGSVLMEHLGRFEDAAACFQSAWDQGYASYDLLVGYITCNHLLDRKQLFAQLVALARHNLTKDELAKLDADVRKLREQVFQSWRAHTQYEEQQAASREESSQAQAGGNEEPTQTAAQLTEPEPPSQEENTMPPPIQDGISTSDVGSPSGEQNFTMPFLNTRINLEGVYSLDFYDDPTAPDYIEQFVRSWREAARSPQLRTLHGTVLTSSTIPFYFTRCPTCEIPILTNRWPGESLRCRRCGKKHTAYVTKDSDLDVLLGRVLEALGKKLTDLTGQMQVVLIQSVDEDDHTKLVEDISFGAGFTPLPQAHPALHYLLLAFKEKKGILKLRPYSLWQKMSDNEQYAYVGETPPEVEHLLRMLRLNGLELNSGSITYDPTDARFAGWQARTETEMIEESLQTAQVYADQYQINTLPQQIGLLLQLGKINEAKEKAQALTRQRSDEAIGWILLGQTEMASGRFQAATEALEKANVIDPVRPLTMFLLAQCYQQLGDTTKAKMWSARWHSLGGSWL